MGCVYANRMGYAVMSEHSNELMKILNCYGNLRILEPEIIPLPKGELKYFSINLQLAPGYSFSNRAKTLEMALQEIYDHIHNGLLEECGLDRG